MKYKTAFKQAGQKAAYAYGRYMNLSTFHVVRPPEKILQ